MAIGTSNPQAAAAKTRKPRRRPAVMTQTAGSMSGAPVPQQYKQPGTSSAPGVTGTPSVPVANPVSPTAPTVVAKPPPVTPQSLVDRTQADAQYGQTVSTSNDALRQAAQNYGGTPDVVQFNPDGTTRSVAAVQNDPLSQVAGIARNLATNKTNESENANSDNTFFSGREVKAQQGLTDEAGRQREQARRDYQNAVDQYTQQILAARMQRDYTRQSADASDISAALANAPEAMMDSPLATLGSPFASNPDAQAELAAAQAAQQQSLAAQRAPRPNRGTDTIKKRPRRKR